MKNILKIFILFIFFITASAMAKDVSIPSVTIMENNQGYGVVLNTNEKVKYKKVSENSNTTYFEIKNVLAPDDIPVKYDNVETIESVTIQKVSTDTLRVYVKGENADNMRLYIIDEAGNPFYLEANKFDGVNGKNIGLLIVGVLIFSMFLSSDKKEDVQVARAIYNNNAMLQNMKQNKIIRINDFLEAQENSTNPIRSEINNNLDLGMVRKSA